MIETEHGKFEVLKDHREALEIKVFNERYVDYLDRYKYIVGDYSAEMLRLKGFTTKNYETIPDYLMESCTPHAPYFVLMRVDDKPQKEENKEKSDSSSSNRRKRRRRKPKK
jgi:uncharacterized protein YutD